MRKNIPENVILLMSGVPGIGKTTLSHMILNTFPEFLMIEETDIIREILLGYDEYLKSMKKDSINRLYDHNVIMDYTMALEQCQIMKASIRNIIDRQQRKGIPTIINGVHILPELLYDYLKSPNLIYITLYTDSIKELERHYQLRNDHKHTKSIPMIFEMNNTLFDRTSDLVGYKDNVLILNVSGQSVFNTNETIVSYMIKYLKL